MGISPFLYLIRGDSCVDVCFSSHFIELLLAFSSVRGSQVDVYYVYITCSSCESMCESHMGIDLPSGLFIYFLQLLCVLVQSGTVTVIQWTRLKWPCTTSSPGLDSSETCTTLNTSDSPTFLDFASQCLDSGSEFHVTKCSHKN